MSLFEKCITENYNLSFKILLDKFMEYHGTIKSLEDQEALIAVQEMFNGMASQLLYNQEMVRYLINQKQFSFTVFSRRLETDRNRIWLNEGKN